MTQAKQLNHTMYKCDKNITTSDFDKYLDDFGIIYGTSQEHEYRF